jgi:hypothetical protein
MKFKVIDKNEGYLGPFLKEVTKMVTSSLKDYLVKKKYNKPSLINHCKG